MNQSTTVEPPHHSGDPFLNSGSRYVCEYSHLDYFLHPASSTKAHMPSTLSLINPLTQPITSKHASPNFCANTPPEQTSLQSQLTKHKPLTHLSPKPLPNPTSQPQQTWSPGNYPQNARQNCHHAHTNVPPTLLPQLHHTPTPAATPSPSTQPPSANPSPASSAPSTLSPA